MFCLVEVDPGVPLPPPKPAAKALKSKVYECIQKWKDKYAEAYKQLALGYNYLKNCKKVSWGVDLSKCFFIRYFLSF